MGVIAALLAAAAAAAWLNVLAGQPADAAEQAVYKPPAVEIDQGVGVTHAQVAAEIGRIVNDRRAWHADFDQWTLRIVEPGIGGTQGLGGHIGMAYRDDHLALITEDAWMTLGPRFAKVGGTLADQRAWIVLHELGHLLGYAHQECRGEGPAPVMRAINYQLGACAYNVWPNP
ncbi:hypothetical protein AB0I89_23850 [Micromonospora sp. NPDC049801]|uniref:hypothetical protein n=1 Tax=unclassified Micromonospora TaxID=2617518 RepID=UPI0033F1A566